MAAPSSRGYFDTTRSFTYSILFALPLLAAYELGAAWMADRGDAALRNGADVLLRTFLAAGGVQGTLAFTGVILAVCLVLIAVEWRRKRVPPLRPAWFAGMMGESVLYALLFGTVVGTVTGWVTGALSIPLQAAPLERLPVREGIVLSLGAGLYEELVFRVLLAGGIFLVFRSMGLQTLRAGAFAAILAALVFSAFHYVGPYAYPWEMRTFVFRFLAGLALNALFLARGFGVAAWTHALYDVFLTLAQPHG